MSENPKLSFGSSSDELERAARFQETWNRRSGKYLAVVFGVIGLIIAANGAVLSNERLLSGGALIVAGACVLWKQANVRPAPPVHGTESPAPYKRSLALYLVALAILVTGFVLAVSSQ